MQGVLLSEQPEWTYRYKPAKVTIKQQRSAVIIQRVLRRAFVRAHVIPKVRYLRYLREAIGGADMFELLCKMQCDNEARKRAGYELFSHQPERLLFGCLVEELTCEVNRTSVNYVFAHRPDALRLGYFLNFCRDCKLFTNNITLKTCVDLFVKYAELFTNESATPEDDGDLLGGQSPPEDGAGSRPPPAAAAAAAEAGPGHQRQWLQLDGFVKILGEMAEIGAYKSRDAFMDSVIRPAVADIKTTEAFGATSKFGQALLFEGNVRILVKYEGVMKPLYVYYATQEMLRMSHQRLTWEEVARRDEGMSYAAFVQFLKEFNLAPGLINFSAYSALFVEARQGHRGDLPCSDCQYFRVGSFNGNRCRICNISRGNRTFESLCKLRSAYWQTCARPDQIPPENQERFADPVEEDELEYDTGSEDGGSVTSEPGSDASTVDGESGPEKNASNPLPAVDAAAAAAQEQQLALVKPPTKDDDDEDAPSFRTEAVSRPRKRTRRLSFFELDQKVVEIGEQPAVLTPSSEEIERVLRMFYRGSRLESRRIQQTSIRLQEQMKGRPVNFETFDRLLRKVEQQNRVLDSYRLNLTEFMLALVATARAVLNPSSRRKLAVVYEAEDADELRSAPGKLENFLLLMSQHYREMFGISFMQDAKKQKVKVDEDLANTQVALDAILERIYFTYAALDAPEDLDFVSFESFHLFVRESTCFKSLCWEQVRETAQLAALKEYTTLVEEDGDIEEQELVQRQQMALIRRLNMRLSGDEKPIEAPETTSTTLLAAMKSDVDQEDGTERKSLDLDDFRFAVNSLIFLQACADHGVSHETKRTWYQDSSHSSKGISPEGKIKRAILARLSLVFSVYQPAARQIDLFSGTFRPKSHLSSHLGAHNRGLRKGLLQKRGRKTVQVKVNLETLREQENPQALLEKQKLKTATKKVQEAIESKSIFGTLLTLLKTERVNPGLPEPSNDSADRNEGKRATEHFEDRDFRAALYNAPRDNKAMKLVEETIASHLVDLGLPEACRSRKKSGAAAEAAAKAGLRGIFASTKQRPTVVRPAKPERFAPVMGSPRARSFLRRRAEREEEERKRETGSVRNVNEYLVSLHADMGSSRALALDCSSGSESEEDEDEDLHIGIPEQDPSSTKVDKEQEALFLEKRERSMLSFDAQGRLDMTHMDSLRIVTKLGRSLEKSEGAERHRARFGPDRARFVRFSNGGVASSLLRPAGRPRRKSRGELADFAEEEHEADLEKKRRIARGETRDDLNDPKTLPDEEALFTTRAPLLDLWSGKNIRQLRSQVLCGQSVTEAEVTVARCATFNLSSNHECVRAASRNLQHIRKERRAVLGKFSRLVACIEKEAANKTKSERFAELLALGLEPSIDPKAADNAAQEAEDGRQEVPGAVLLEGLTDNRPKAKLKNLFRVMDALRSDASFKQKAAAALRKAADEAEQGNEAASSANAANAANAGTVASASGESGSRRGSAFSINRPSKAAKREDGPRQPRVVGMQAARAIAAQNRPSQGKRRSTVASPRQRALVVAQVQAKAPPAALCDAPSGTAPTAFDPASAAPALAIPESASRKDLAVAFMRAFGEGSRTSNLEQLCQALQLAHRLTDDKLVLAAGSTLTKALRKHGYPGGPEQALSLLQGQLELSRRLGNRVTECAALGELGKLFHGAGKFEQAELTHRDWLKVATEVAIRAADVERKAAEQGGCDAEDDANGSDDEEGPALKRRQQRDIICAPRPGEPLAARAALQSGVGGALAGVGNALRGQQRLEEALEVHEEHLKFAVALGHPEELACALSNLAGVLIEMGRLAPALDYLAEELSIYLGSSQGRQSRVFSTLRRIADLQLKSGAHREREATLQRWLELANSWGAVEDHAEACHALVALKLAEVPEEAERTAVKRSVRALVLDDPGAGVEAAVRRLKQLKTLCAGGPGGQGPEAGLPAAVLHLVAATAYFEEHLALAKAQGVDAARLAACERSLCGSLRFIGLLDDGDDGDDGAEGVEGAESDRAAPSEQDDKEA